MSSATSRAIYLDNHASTRCDPRVVERMLPYLLDTYANPSGEAGEMGRSSARAVDHARAQIAEFLGGEPDEVFFTSGSTESNNIAILGSYEAAKQGGKFVTSAIEHKSVLGPMDHLQERGLLVDKLPVDRKGRVDTEFPSIDSSTKFVSVHLANNEIGTVQDIPSLSQACRRVGALIHTDASQAAGRIPLDVTDLGVDMLSISGHKMHGPKGVGVLYVRREVISKVRPVGFGGSQERGLRPGTLNVPSIVGMAEACRISRNEISNEARRLSEMRDSFESSLSQLLDGVFFNGDDQNRLPNNSSVTVPGVDASLLLAHIPGVVMSIGSACNHGAMEPSHVLQAIGLKRDEAESTFRIGFGRFNSMEDAIIAARLIARACEEFRAVPGLV